MNIVLEAKECTEEEEGEGGGRDITRRKVIIREKIKKRGRMKENIGVNLEITQRTKRRNGEDPKRESTSFQLKW